MPNIPFDRTRATKRLGVFKFRGVARGGQRGRLAGRDDNALFRTNNADL
jgi:hypothetical protein